MNIVGDVIGDVIKTTFTPTGNAEADKTRGENYANAVGMDDANKAMAVVMATKGLDAAAKAMMDDCGGDYCLMRSRYG